MSKSGGTETTAIDIAMDPPVNAAAIARAEVFDALHAEMDYAEYARGPSGQRVKRVPRNQAPARTTKRKALLEADMLEMAIEVDDDNDDDDDDPTTSDGKTKGGRKRLRGARVAFDSTVLKSMPALPNNGYRKEGANGGRKGVESKEDGDNGGADIELDDRYELLQGVAALGIDLGLDDDEKLGNGFDGEGVEDDLSIEDDDFIPSSEDDESGNENDENDVTEEKTRLDDRVDISVSIKSTNDVTTKKKIKNKKIKPKRVMHRLKDFTSRRLADKHGEAIGAHIMGMSETAVQKLREVAKTAPGAPQVYSSLGMVFDSMLTEAEGRSDSTEPGGDVIQCRMELAQKVYASYHVASLLTKRDFVLWERSGDAAIKVAQIYSELISNQLRNTNVRGDKWRSQQRVWMEYALAAYQSSDKLRPPGVDVPCKLAQVHMNLGSYIEALSILTDLRNKASGESSAGCDDDLETVVRCSEMEGSYPCWLLYSDLMMKIGYECKEWNEGTSTCENYTFKRWLKKNSKDFDWSERRLQSLCLALEAAAGSASCCKLIRWMRKRAEIYSLGKLDVDVDDANDSNDEDNHLEKKSNDINASEKDVAIPAIISTYEEERERLVHMNKMELQMYDRKTKEMNLVAGSLVYKSRIDRRAELIEKHRIAIKDLAMRKFAEGQQSNSVSNEQTDECDFPPKPLPLQGSFATVYDIAVLLLRQCNERKLFDGGILVIQSVMNYSKERLARHHRQMEKRNEQPKVAGNGLVQTGFQYDQINFESDDSDNEGIDSYISDDDELEKSEAFHLLETGFLPYDIRAMHAICLLGVGGQDYVALNYVEQVITSDEMNVSSNDGAHYDGCLSNDPRWVAFSKHFHATINKSFVLACVANIVGGDEENESRFRSKRVLQIFRNHLSGTDNDQEKNDRFEDTLKRSKEPERTNTVKVLLVTLKMMIQCSRVDLSTLHEPGKEEAEIVEHAVTDSMYTLQTMLRFHHEFWKPRFSDSSLPEFSIDMVSILSGALSILVQAATLSEEKRGSEFVCTKARHLISIICRAESSTSSSSKTVSTVGSLRSFPLPCHWQTSFHEKLSLTTYNLCVACCVSAFSGWEPSEFNLDNLRDRGANFFGVSLEGECVHGFVANSVAFSVAEQWELLSTLFPELERLPFERYLEEQTRLSWYKKVMANMEKQSIDSKKIVSYGEDDGIKALISFSRLCLIAAEGNEGDERQELLACSLSVLLPITQFCIDKPVWVSNIGTSSINHRNDTKVDYYLDDNSNWLGPTKSQYGQAQGTTRVRAPRSSTNERPNQRPRKPNNSIKVPTSALLKLWTSDVMHEVVRRDATKNARLSMKKIDDAMQNLRKSRTLNSLERASIDVAVALIAVMAYDECDNPFVCLQQAAMFAGLGSKRGNNDEAFKIFLPLKHKCTPLEALSILGRADCLRAIHFLHEAQFLTSWVASVCHSHRAHMDSLPWNSRWQVIGIMMYTMSSFIEETSDALYNNNPVPEASLRKWEDMTKEEIRSGKSDALALVNSTTHLNQNVTNGGEKFAESNSFTDPDFFDESHLDLAELAVEECEDYDPYDGIEVVGV